MLFLSRYLFLFYPSVSLYRVEIRFESKVIVSLHLSRFLLILEMAIWNRIESYWIEDSPIVFALFF